MSEQNNTSVEDDEKNLENIRLVISFASNAVQKYLAYLQGKEPQELFGDSFREPIVIGFQYSNGEKRFLKLDLVDWKTYKFDINGYNCLSLRDFMANIINNLQPLMERIIQYDIKEQDLPKKEYFTQPIQTVVDPNTNIFIFNPCPSDKAKNDASLKEMHENYDKKIGFVWA